MTADNDNTKRHVFLRPDALELIPNAAFAYDGDRKLFYLNAIAAKWFGVKDFEAPIPESEFAIEVSIIDEQLPIPDENTPWQRAWNREAIEDLELSLKAPCQEPRIIQCNCKSIGEDVSNNRLAIISMIDVSSVRKEYLALLNGRAHMRMIMEGTDAGTWQWNIQTGAINVNERWAQIIGYSVKELTPVTVEIWRGLIHPDDTIASDQLFKKHFAGEIPQYNLALRMKHKKGHWVWIQGRGRVYQWDTEGKPLWMAGTFLDISNIRAAEQEARASQAYMQALIDSSLEVAIIATDTRGLITVFNTGAERLLGYTEGEVVGKLTPAPFHLEEEVIARGKELSSLAGTEISGFDVFVYAARNGRSETRKWTYVCKSGEHRKVSLTVSTLRDDSNRVLGFLGMAVDETAKLAAENKASLAAKSFAGAFSSTAVGMALVSLEGKWMEVNDALCEMFGYTRDELLQTDFQTLTHPDDLQADLELVELLLADSIPHYEMQKRYFKKNGKTIQSRLWVALVRDVNGVPLHFVSQIQNITEEYSARQALLGSEARLRGLFDLSPIGISLLDYKSGKRIEANESLVAPSGYTRAEFMELTERELTPPEYAPLMSDAVDQLRKFGRYSPFEKEFIRKDGTRYPILVQGILMKEPTGRKVVWSLVEDISERKRLDRIKNEFVSTVSHELRTPLTSISGALSLIVGGVLGEVNEDVLDMLKIAAKSSERLSVLVNDLLDMDKLLAGKMELKIEKVDLLPLLDDALSGMAAFAHSCGVEIVRCEDTAMQIQSDSTRLIQVLTNLLSNACKHSERGSKVELHHAAGPEDSVILSVIDHGKGVPKEFRTSIFQKFAQADGSDSSDRKGTGLGLAICKELIERMGGVIGFESHEGVGSHFWVRLPRAKTHLSTGQQMPRILHVEDDVDFAKLISINVSNWVKIDLATNLAEANRRIRNNHYDLILLDLTLPDGSGEALWESLHLAQPDVPIIILSGHEVPRKLANNVAAVLIKDDKTLAKVISTLHQIFEIGE